ncbi:type II toxin-antitoxin system VapC family toxin [Sphingomonas cavernae]|uniref:type II toxin-antitoxin system VapC family toxin n=1 Tax=Sphingomonas cavernae TaxID=2320861 RepID=UPI001EE62A36|nr:type II toxin-antitoxin system VapC family toxin [Sphingomonas cavernae]
MYLLDTNVCIDFARGRSEALRQRMRAALSHGLVMSAITYGELAVGSRDSSDPECDWRKLEKLAEIVSVVPFDETAGEAYGRLGRAVGVRRKSFDRLIAAHALSLELTLVTNNEADFADVPGLNIENWSA